MVVAEGLTWLQFISLPHISSLSVNRQLMEFDDYNHQIILEAIARQQQYDNANDVFAVGSGRKATSTEEFPGGGSGALTFNGSDQYFTALNSDVVNWLPGTGDFTIEMFIKKGVGGSGAPRVFSLGNDTGATIGISVEGGYVYVWPYGGDLRGSLPTTYSVDNLWMHVAICRSGTTTKLYMDGVLKATKTGDNRNITDALNPGFDLNVGVDDPEGNANFWSGNLTNFRWDNSAIYTGASLTVPTSPLSTTATTKLLMLGGGSTNPVYDAAKLNGLVNHGAEWTADTPFV